MTTDTAYQIPLPVFSEQALREERRPPPRSRLWLPLRDTPAYRAAYRPEACTTQELLAAGSAQTSRKTTNMMSWYNA
ncbi:MAG: hypothetical protein P1P76_12100 [Anaerolineales bacterium]|nr:hypothetical protein [Anaerolineales bacterium]